MGFSWDDLGYAVPGLNTYKAGKYAYDKTLGKAADEKRDGYGNAADAYTQQGQQDWAKYQQGLGQANAAYDQGWHTANYATTQGKNQALGEYDKAQGVYDSEAGYFNNPGMLEQLYNQRRTGTDPYFNYMQGQLVNQNAASFGARGMNNSTMAAQAQNGLLAKLTADQSLQMADLAHNASGEQRNRMSDKLSGQEDISKGRAGIEGDAAKAYSDAAMKAAAGKSGAITDMYKGGIDALDNNSKNAIAMQLAKAGVSQEVINQILSTAVAGGKIAAAA